MRQISKSLLRLFSPVTLSQAQYFLVNLIWEYVDSTAVLQGYYESIRYIIENGCTRFFSVFQGKIVDSGYYSDIKCNYDFYIADFTASVHADAHIYYFTFDRRALAIRNYYAIGATIFAGNLRCMVIANSELRELHLHCPCLYDLFICSNQLSEIDLSGVPYLETLQIYQNKLYTLDVSMLSHLRELDASSNRLESIALPPRGGLQKLFVHYNKLQQLYVKHCRALQQLVCYHNRLKVLDCAGMKQLWKLWAANNQIEKLMCYNCDNLKTLSAYSNRIRQISLHGLQNLERLSLYDNYLTEISINGLWSLKEALLHYNYIININGILVGKLQFLSVDEFVLVIEIENQLVARIKPKVKMIKLPTTGLEPATPGLRVLCSTD